MVSIGPEGPHFLMFVVEESTDGKKTGVSIGPEGPHFLMIQRVLRFVLPDRLNRPRRAALSDEVLNLGVLRACLNRPRRAALSDRLLALKTRTGVVNSSH